MILTSRKLTASAPQRKRGMVLVSWMSARLLNLALFSGMLFVSSVNGGEPSSTEQDDVLILEAFTITHRGYSSDELLVRSDLRESYLDKLAQLQSSPLDVDERRNALLRLLALRKAGKLNIPTSERGTSPSPADIQVAEIAARVVIDRHRTTTDTMLADDRLRAEFLDEAARVTASIDDYSLGKAVLRLRKIRQLKPELVLRVADWKREIVTLTLVQLKHRLREGAISTGPGIYLFRDASGYLYIGEASNLESRLCEHVGGSDRVTLAKYLAKDAESTTVELHIFPRGTPADRLEVRRAYESELIRSRQPKFNIRP